MKKFVSNKFKKFLYVGALSTVLDYVLYSLLIYCDMNYMVSITIGYLSGFAVSFLLTRQYVFDEIKIQNFFKEIFWIVIITILALLLNILIVSVMYDVFEVNLYISRVVAILIVLFFNYFTRKGFIYG